MISIFDLFNAHILLCNQPVAIISEPFLTFLFRHAIDGIYIDAWWFISPGSDGRLITLHLLFDGGHGKFEIVCETRL
jgi:hypothetical protein